MKDTRRVNSLTILAFVIASVSALSMLWQINSSQKLRLHTEYAENVLAEYLHLKANVYQLFKQYGDALIIGDQDKGAGEAALAAEIAVNFDKLRYLIGKEIDLLGESEIEELVVLDEIKASVDAITNRFETVLADEGEGSVGLERWRTLSQILDVEIDEVFISLIRTAIAEERQEVEIVRAEIAQQERFVTYFAGVLVAIALISVVASLLSFYKRFSQPLVSVLEGVHKFSRGQFTHRIALSGYGDIREISNALDLMADHVQEKQAQLEEKNAELETRVRERTLELERLLSRSEEMESNRSQLLADVSHEIRTPLTIIQGEAEIALRGKDWSAEEYRESLQQALDASKHCSQLVSDLLFVSRQEAGVLRLDRKQSDLLDVVGEALSIFGDGVTLQSDLVLAPAEFDTVRIRQSVLALLHNARRYGAGEIDLSVSETDKGYSFTVSDNGQGMTDDEKSRAFERFFRGSNAAHYASEGTGLGLPVVKAIIEAHNGSVALSDAAAGGLSVTCTLPAPKKPKQDANVVKLRKTS